MTREHRLVLSLDEIQGVRWQCTKCGSAISYQLDQSIRLPQACHACNEPFLDQPSFESFRQLQTFIDALKGTLRVMRANQLGATLKLELADSPDA